MGLIYIDGKGNQCFQEAGKVILACNGIGTPRILLNSKSKNFPDGLANSSGLLGKNLMFHPYASVNGYFEEDVNYTLGPLANIIINITTIIPYYITNGPAHTALGTGNIKNVQWGKDHHKEFSRRFKKSLGMAIISEDLPELHNRVEIDESRKDKNGMPLPKIFYKTSQNTRNLLDHGMKSAEKLLLEAGSYEVNHNPLLETAGWHLMGTAKMGDDPKTSVVNSNCETHDIDNLFIIDGSVFTTSAAVNPTPTIQAIALRTADIILGN